MKIISKTFYVLFIAMLLAVTGLFLASLLPIPGNIEIKIVKSGSMDPAIKVGSLVIIKPTLQYAVGDVVTFGDDTRTKIPTTHRVVSIRQESGIVWYTTKGDANEEADTQQVRHDEVIGKVFLAVPYAGFILDFAKQPMGFLFLIALPAAIIILDELLSIYREVRTKWGRRGPRSRGGGGSLTTDEPRFFVRRFKMDDMYLPMPTSIPKFRDIVSPRQYTNVASSLFAVAIAISGSLNSFGGTLSYFRDGELSADNALTAGEWGVTIESLSDLSIASSTLEESVPSEVVPEAEEDVGDSEVEEEIPAEGEEITPSAEEDRSREERDERIDREERREAAVDALDVRVPEAEIPVPEENQVTQEETPEPLQEL